MPTGMCTSRLPFKEVELVYFRRGYALVPNGNTWDSSTFTRICTGRGPCAYTQKKGRGKPRQRQGGTKANVSLEEDMEEVWKTKIDGAKNKGGRIPKFYKGVAHTIYTTIL